MKKERIVDLEISDFSKHGHGLAYQPYPDQPDSKPRKIEVPFAIPGDKVRAKLLGRKSGVTASLLEEVLEPSPNRIAPRCIHFGLCGGCRWQQQSYQQQLQNKQAIVQRYFGSAILPIIPCDPPWEYRNKMEFSFSASAAGERYLGLVMNGGRGKAFNLTECHLVHSWFADCVKAVKSWWDKSTLQAYHPYKNSGSLRTLTVREGQRTGDRMVILTVSGNPDYALNRGQLEELVAVLRKSIEPQESASHLSLFLRIQQIAKGSRTSFFEMHLYGTDSIREQLTIATGDSAPPTTLTFTISPAAFFQPNTRQAERLYATALNLVSIDSTSVVYDLYCGTGTLGMCAASQAKQVIGIELSPEAVLDAKGNAAQNRIDNIEFLGGDVGEVLARIREQGSHPLPDLVMVDPPRAGLGEQAIHQILSLKPKTILYVSCNPATQATDVAAFLEKGYQIGPVQPVDQFPHTIHIENILVLRSREC